MSWDIAIHGELSFPSTDAVRAWHDADVDPPPVLPSPMVRGSAIGSVDQVLEPLAKRRFDWVTITESADKVTLAGMLTKDGFASYAEEIVAAARAAKALGARGELFMVGLGVDLGLRLDVATGTLEKHRAEVDTSAILQEGRRRANLPEEPPPQPSPALFNLANAASADAIVATLKSTPVADYWKEVTILDEQLPKLHEKLGADVVRVVAALVERRLGLTGDKVQKLLFALESVPATEILVQDLAPPLMAGETAAWLVAHPAVALPPLKALADGSRPPPRRRVPPIAPVSELARRVIAEIEHPATADLPSKKKGGGKGPAWFHPAVFARPRLADGSPISSAAALRLVAMLKDPSSIDPNVFERGSLDRFLLELFTTWCAANAPKTGSHFAEALRVLGGPDAKTELERLAERPTVAGRQAKALLDP